MKKLVLVLVLVSVLVVLVATVASALGPVVHSVHIGGPDICPGCDKNFSLVRVLCTNAQKCATGAKL